MSISTPRWMLETQLDSQGKMRSHSNELHNNCTTVNLCTTHYEKEPIREDTKERYLAYIFLKHTAKTGGKLRINIISYCITGGKKILLQGKQPSITCRITVRVFCVHQLPRKAVQLLRGDWV